MVEEDLRRKLLRHMEKISSYVLQKTNRDRKVEVALLALTIQELHLYMNPVLAPECPEAYLAQFEALKEVLNDVIGFINSERFTDDIGKELIGVLLTRLKHFVKFVGLCYGFDLNIQLGVLGKEGLVFDVNLPEPQPSLSADKLREEYLRELNKVFKDYHDQLIDYIYRKSGQDWRIPLALMALPFAELHDIMDELLSENCPDYLKTYLESAEEVLGNLVKILRGTSKLKEDAKNWFALTLAVALKFYLEFLAFCHGAELELKVEPVGGHIFMSVAKYRPLPSQAPQSNASQEGGGAS